VTGTGALVLLAASALFEDMSQGVFGWWHPIYAIWFFTLSCVSGVLGHTGFNACLMYG